MHKRKFFHIFVLVLMRAIGYTDFTKVMNLQEDYHG